MSNSSIWPIDRNLLGANCPGQSGPGSNDIEEVYHISQNSKTGALSSDSLIPYAGHSFWESYSSTEMQLVYSTTPTDNVMGQIDLFANYLY